MLFFILTISCTLNWADSKNCPDKYARLSEDHTYCRDPYPSCDRKHSGVSEDDIDHILKLHNTYRSQVAMGQETRAGGLPQASDMLQMVWDNELAAVAQKWADNCDFNHDCKNCRAVGQNLAEDYLNCYMGECLKSLKPRERNGDWASKIKKMYDEVDYFDKSFVPEFHFNDIFAHFTQIIWAKTWRIGCGITGYLNGDSYNKFYVCNYGPACQVIYSQFGLAIHQNDHQARRRFIEWAQNEIAVVPDFHKRILFSDEAHFWLNGYVNKQNCRIWSEANPQVYVETPLHPEKLTIWCALWAGGIIGPYFFKNDEGHNVTVNGDRYRAMITNFFIPELNNHDVQELWFQQDGATCHTARAAIDLLKDTLGDRLISRFGPVNWPPRSCDLTPLDYFLWGYVNSLVYADKPQALDHLEDNIRRVIADIRPQMLEKVIENWTSRLDYIRASRGSHMPEIIFKISNNYNPLSSGNVWHNPVYEQGRPGSACPINSCIGGETCTGGNDYPGLCKMLNPNTAPVYRRKQRDALFFCDFEPETKDCDFTVKGKKLEYDSNLQGNFTRILLRGGESSTIVFKKPISPKKERFCLRVLMKKEPYYPDQQDESILRADFDLADGYTVKPMYLPYDYDPEYRNQFQPSSANLNWGEETSVSIP
ncbi:hypothetical protein TNCV_3973831 [Trichonephila clavipes]|nr:hypothetical protein TNCV_3973831 [Trichonephila clavipes]